MNNVGGVVLISVRDRADDSPLFILAKSVLCIGVIKIKSNQIQAVQHRRRKTEVCIVSCHMDDTVRERCSKTWLPPYSMLGS